MKTVNFDFKINSLSGEPIETFNVQETVANAIASQSTQKPVRSLELARKIFNDGKIELLSEDEELIKGVILSNTQITDLVKAQLLEAFDVK